MGGLRSARRKMLASKKDKVKKENPQDKVKIYKGKVTRFIGKKKGKA